MDLKAILEGLLFVSGNEGLSKEQIKEILEIDDITFNKVINDLYIEYDMPNRGIKLEYLGNRFKLVTKKEYKDYLQKLVDISESDFLSSAALEILAIIAYNQPITRVTIDDIRGISSGHIVRKLVFKNLICEVGRSQTAGRPILYGTTPLFLDYFGLKALTDLPPIEQKKEEDDIIDLYQSRYNEE